MPTKKTPIKKVSKKASAKKKVVASAKIKQPNETCFVIMPFGGWFDDYYETIYKPAIIESSLDPKRADDLYRPSTIVNDIWQYTQSSKIVLADLTGKNPNVFYELGLAHALAKPAILITESMDDVPFDLRALRILEYDKNKPNWGTVLQRKITLSIKEVLEAPLEAVLPAFLEVKPSTKTKAVSERDKEVLELRQEIDLVKRDLRRYRSRNIQNDRMFDGPDEATEALQSYMRRGLPKSIIIRRMTERGAPKEWVLDEIKGPSQPFLFDEE